MAVVQVFEPPRCCPTGVCGPSVDPERARFNGALEWLDSQGVQVRRFNLAQTASTGVVVRQLAVAASCSAPASASAGSQKSGCC